MKMAVGPTQLNDTSSPSGSGGRIAKWVMTAALGLLAVLGIGHLAISLAWLLVDPSARWRDRSTEDAVVVGGVMLVILTLTFTMTARANALVRAVAVLAVGIASVGGLSMIPHTRGGVQPTCVVPHLDPTAFNAVVMQAMGFDIGRPPSMDLLYSAEGWHHFRLPDGRHAVVPHELVVALETCQE